MLFNPSQVYMPNRHRQPSALRTFFPSSSFSPPDSKEPLRRGILFSSVAAVLMLVGAILTWLGFNDVFGGKISMTGPLLIALALLMLLLSLRQFMLARKRNRSTSAPVQMDSVSTGGLTAVVVDHDDGNGAATIVVETWESEEPNNDTLSYRNIHDLAPPSYMDIAQSCSSNCPSFISHEDHNEAPPTYEETCGVYNSQSSLTNSSSRRCSFQTERSPSLHRTYHSGYNCFHNENSYNEDTEIQNESYQSHRPSDLLSRKTSFTITQPLNHQTSMFCRENNIALPPSLVDSQLARNTAGQSILQQTSQCPGNENSAVLCAVSSSNSSKPSEWSRRSFSSIPSYTCLLSESGEVSSQVYDTSSIIEEMIPLLVMNDTTRDPPPTDQLMNHTIIPTRSHSMSSVNTCRQGVPYSSDSHCGQTSPRTVNQLIHDTQPMSEISPSSSNHNKTYGVISEISSPSSSNHNKTSCVISEVSSPSSSNHNKTHGVITEISSSSSNHYKTCGVISEISPSSSNHNKTSGVIYKSTSSPLQQDSQLRCESEPHLLDLLAAQPVTGSALLQPLPVGTTPSTSSLSRHSSEVTDEQRELLPLLESLDVPAKQKSKNKTTAAIQDGNTSSYGLLSNAQDVQETI